MHQLCFTALAIACDNVATRFFIKADDTFIAKEIAFVFIVVLFCIGFSFSLIFRFYFVLSINFVNLKILLLGISEGRGALPILRRTLNGNLALHTKLCLKLHKLGNRLHHFLSSRTELLALALGNGGGIGLLDDFLGGFDDMLFYNGSLSCISRRTLGNNSTLGGLHHRDLGFLRNNGRFNLLLCFFNNLFFVLLGHNGILGGNQVRDSLLCSLIVLVAVGIGVFILLFELLALTVSGLFLCSRQLSSFLCCLLCCQLCGSCLFCRLCGNQQISLGVTKDQKQAKNKRSHCGSDSQHQKGQLCRGRYCAKGKRRHCVVRSPIVIIFVVGHVYLTATRAAQLADEHTNACDFGAQNTRQYSDSNVINVFYAQPD